MAFDPATEAAVVLILFARLGGVLMLLPAFGDEQVPGPVRLLLALGTTAALSGLLRPAVLGLANAEDPALPWLLATEVATGLAIGTLIRTFFHAITMVGSIISLQIGLTSALVFDPAVGGQTPVLGKLVTLGSIVLCLSLGLHHLWFAALVQSYSIFPAGEWLRVADWTSLFVETLGQATLLAVSLSAPFLIYGMLFNLALGLATRLAPAIQLFFIAQPLAIGLGFALLALTAGTIMSTFADQFGSWLLDGWARG